MVEYRNSHLHPRSRVRSLASLSCAGQYSREMCGVVGVKRDHWLCAASLCISLSLGYVAALFVGRTTIKSLVVESPPPTERSPISDVFRVPVDGNFHEILDERPHIVFVLADDLGYNDVGYGSLDLHACTPNLDAMWRDGVELTSLYAAPTCTPSRAALLTARYPTTLGMQHWQLEAAAPYGLDSSTATLGEVFQRQGYATVFVGKWHLGHFSEAVLPTRRGFEKFYGFYTGGENYFTRVSEGACAPVVNTSVPQVSEVGDIAKECFWDAIDNEAHEDLPAPEELHGKSHSTYAFAMRASDLVARHGSFSGGGLAQPILLVLALPNPHVPLLAPAAVFRTHDAILRQITNNQRRTFAALTILWDEALGNVSAACHGLVDIDGIDHWTCLRDGLGNEPRDEVLLNIDYLDADLEYLGYLRAAIISCTGTHSSGDSLVINSDASSLPDLPLTGTTTCFKGLYNVEEVFWYATPQDPYTTILLKPNQYPPFTISLPTPLNVTTFRMNILMFSRHSTGV
ncbi:hypothetical protein AURANDRAFT_72312 [Aureococcus anophagefferens]|uniref:Uncharacterized protein ARS3 n=1 Tax=Aureococcus anophagefferens TaxID=44056 RepID=F0YI74_AURAN|nr:hypothetical protein AURANDRAFT_72312 [Aureococcus anophagefferens]EGB05178.1 hypothetical protein AURANDRAFT_72312 [Aureococcus anophagefferens]|eukprot:XP_009040079.1 hypothetical protein AURANDRAFT_72312 [Aureococcus anophagefferens]